MYLICRKRPWFIRCFIYSDIVSPGADLSDADLRAVDFSLANVTKVKFDGTFNLHSD